MNLIAILTNDTKVKVEKVTRFIFFAENKELCYQCDGDYVMKTMDNVKVLENEGQI
jgi:hypothetical protein